MRRWSVMAKFAVVLTVTSVGFTVVTATGEAIDPVLPPVEDVGVTLAARAPVDPVGDAVIAPPPAAFAGPVRLQAPPPLLSRKPALGTGVWAVVIGVDDYPGSSNDLRFAGADAVAFNDMLAEVGVPADQRLVLRDGQASAGTIRAGAQWLVDHAGPEATAVFFYAGHVRKLGSGREGMVGADGKTVSDVDLARLLEPLQAARTWLAIAGCYGGGFTEPLRDGRILTAAAPADQLAYENTAYGHSYFVEYVVNRAIREQRHRTVEAAFAAAVEQLRAEHPDRLPVQVDQLGGDLLLGSPTASSTAPAAAAPPRSDNRYTSPGGGSSEPPPATVPGGGSSGGGTGSGYGAPPGSGNRCKGVTLFVVHCD